MYANAQPRQALAWGHEKPLALQQSGGLCGTLDIGSANSQVRADPYNELKTKG